MRRRFVLMLSIQFALYLCFFSNLKAQEHDGDLALYTQADVDGFNFTSVTGNLSILGSFNITDITNLNGLSELVSVGKKLTILNNAALTSLAGLSSLKSIGHLDVSSIALIIQNNDALSNLNGLISLERIGGLEIKGNNSLTSIAALSVLTEDNVRYIHIEDNPALASLEGLSSIKRINGIFNPSTITLKIVTNEALASLDGLANLTNVDGVVLIESNPALVNLGLSELQKIRGSLKISNNQALVDLGLSNLKEIEIGLLEIFRNIALPNLDGLSNLINVGFDLRIMFNESLIDFCGLYELFHSGSIGGIIFIHINGANTVAVTPPEAVIVNADPGLCSATLLDGAIGTAVPVGCLESFITSHSNFPEGNAFPVGSTQITWTVTDGAGNSASATQTITVIDNQPPLITCPGNITVKCASDVPLVDINSVTATDNCSVVISHESDEISNQTCANRFTLTRTYMATDVGSNTATCSQVIRVHDDIPPQITGFNVSKQSLWPPNHTMRDITLNYTASDNCVSDPIVTITVSSNEPVNGTGDGDTDPDWEIIDDHHVKLRAERAASGDGRIYTITVTVDDGCNPAVSQSKEVVVVHNITGPQSGKPFKVGSIVNFSGVFQDKPGITHTAKWLLDDNISVKGIVAAEPTAAKNGQVTGSYKFTGPGVYKLQMNVTDQNGVTSYANTNGDLEAIVVIYDPNGGHTYGGGYYNSPAGALRSDPTATGKASYGFAMNYFKNSTYPKGETQFEFKVGSFEFNALNFDYLVISNSMAQFKGTGKIVGGQSGIGFTITVTDGELDGTGIDKIRMKIYNKSNGTIIYDNQPGASDAALPMQAVGSNSIVVISGTNSSLTSANTNQKAERETKAPEGSSDLAVIAFPNPSTNNFTINVNAKANERITMQVVDMYGRIIETRNVNANTPIRFGDRYNAGTYFVRILQGKEHKEIKLVKLSD